MKTKQAEQKLNDLQIEATQKAAIGDYLGATEVYKEINARREGREYIRDPHPQQSYEAKQDATAKMLLDYVKVLDTQVVDEGVTASIVIKVKNTYHKKVSGALDLYLMDKKGKIVRTWLATLPMDGIVPGGTTRISTSINKQNFAKVEFGGDRLREED